MTTTFHDFLERMKVNVTSPDRTVSAGYSGRGGITVSFRQGAFTRHDEASLVTQIDHALDGVTTGFDSGMSHIYKARGIQPPPTEPTGTRTSRYRQRFRELAYELKSYATSPLGCVKVRISNNHRINVRIAPGTLNRMDMTEERLASELLSALTEASRDYSTKRRDLRDTVYADLG